MKKVILLNILTLAFGFLIRAQDDFKPGGTGTGTLFFNYHYDMTKDALQKSAFEIERAYLGYSYHFSKSLSARVVFDVVNDGKAYTAFAKNAQLDWQIIPKLKLTAGIFSLKQFDTQEEFWGYRYIMKTFDDAYGLGPSADLGLNLEIPLNKIVTFNAFVLNGEGYKSLQDKNGTQRIGGDIVVKPINGLTAKFYTDIMPGKDKEMPVDTTNIINTSAFLEYVMNDKFRIGMELNNMWNGKDYKSFADGYKLGGISIFSTYILNPEFEFFARYDKLKSNKVDSGSNPWNLSKDGTLLLGGIQYMPVKGVRLALNYRAWLFDQSGMPSESEVYINIGLNF
jgi:hypothetical protein